MSENQTAGQPAKVLLTVSGILNDLANGLSRANIQAKYGLTNKDLKGLFAHPKLKGKKTVPAPAFELVDDTVEDATSEDAMTEMDAPMDVSVEEIGTANEVANEAQDASDAPVNTDAPEDLTVTSNF